MLLERRSIIMNETTSQITKNNRIRDPLLQVQVRAEPRIVQEVPIPE